MADYGVVLVTASSPEEARAISEVLLQEKLAACISTTAIQSLYVWEGAVQDDQEWQLMIKTDLSLFSEVEAKIKAVHSYDVPEIIALPIVQGSTLYLDWIGESTVNL
ncbi:divalent-cation tolerance protein CutA [Spirulina sp. CS-785/01]|uniref:divalent-cation tolerance protein CutA n=1 Tax=Spirulina sp. CS-785/01 TaxID=3021716 RepID=UPI00232AE56E|nr:divalent-cation tolerance protein CutA [Spirulina sp. CS-785/01]MDB9312765.1 divalent-cation tolerance protein CutA [Spirulina sp. CS-785/01]